MTPSEVVAAYLDGDMPYPEAYQRLAYADVRDPGRVLAGQAPALNPPITVTAPQGWDAAYRRFA